MSTDESETLLFFTIPDLLRHPHLLHGCWLAYEVIGVTFFNEFASAIATVERGQ
jgi:hypothetical protein